MAKHENKTFTDQRVELDGNEFHNCRFDGCSIVFSGEGAFPVLNAPAFDRCNFVLEGAAQRTANYLRLLYAAGGEPMLRVWMPELFDQAAAQNMRTDG